MILAIGYRTNSKNAVKFRQWATARLKEYLVQCYSINQSRLDELGKTIKLLAEKGKTIDPDEAEGQKAPFERGSRNSGWGFGYFRKGLG